MKLVIEKLAYEGKVVLEKIDQNVEYGDFINVIGQNGSGKSSLFKALLGITRFKGKVDFASSEIAVVSDYARVPKELQVRDILEFAYNYSKVDYAKWYNLAICFVAIFIRICVKILNGNG